MTESLHNQRYNVRVQLIGAARRGDTARVRELADQLDAIVEQMQPKPKAREEKRGRDRQERGGHDRAE